MKDRCPICEDGWLAPVQREDRGKNFRKKRFVYVRRCVYCHTAVEVDADRCGTAKKRDSDERDSISNQYEEFIYYA